MQFREFTRTGVWQMRLAALPRPRAILIRMLRILLLAWRGFRDDKCPLRASALTFYSLLSLVPIAAMLFGIAKGFGFQNKLRVELLDKFLVQWRPVSEVSIGSPEFVQNILPVYKVKCTYDIERDGAAETVSPTFVVREIRGQPGRWYVTWFVFEENEGSSDED